MFKQMLYFTCSVVSVVKYSTLDILEMKYDGYILRLWASIKLTNLLSIQIYISNLIYYLLFRTKRLQNNTDIRSTTRDHVAKRQNSKYIPRLI